MNKRAKTVKHRNIPKAPTRSQNGPRKKNLKSTRQPLRAKKNKEREKHLKNWYTVVIDTVVLKSTAYRQNTITSKRSPRVRIHSEIGRAHV